MGCINDVYVGVKVECKSTFKCIGQLQTHIFCTFLGEQVPIDVVQQKDVEMDTSGDNGILKPVTC